MHKILERQLRRFQIDPDSLPSLEDWKEFLAFIDRAYQQADQDRYLLERSLAISSREMQDLHTAERQRAQEALEESEDKYRNLFENAFDSIFIIDATSRKILDVNQIAANRLGYAREELLEMTIDDLNPASETAGSAEIIQRIHETGNLTFERTHVRKDGTMMPVEVSTAIIEYQGKKIYQSIVRDITERKRAEEELKRLASHDSLTGLPNRALFEDRLSHAIDIADRNNEILAVLFLDLDDFKQVNDAFGHNQGDRLLQTISSSFVENVRRSDTVARLGGDEFAILFEGVSQRADAGQAAEKIIGAISKPFMIQGAEVFITASLGISIFPKDGRSPDTLIQNADRAMYASKAEGKNKYCFYDAEMQTMALERLELGNQLRHAIEEEELSIYYQPQVDSRTGRIFGVEALLRWDHPDLGLMTPDQFISLAEQSGLIVPLSEWVLETACRQMKAWTSNGLPKTRLAVNLSERDLNHPDLVRKIEKTLLVSGYPPEQLELELSERIVFRRMDETDHRLKRLKALGVRLAIDDFGTGYSTLSQLAAFPVDTLKIDQKFAPHLISSSNYAAIVKGVATIAKNLGVEVVAEGIEKQDQLDFYESLGCHLIQGWIFSKAVPAEEVPGLVKKGVPRPQLQLGLDMSAETAGE